MQSSPVGRAAGQNPQQERSLDLHLLHHDMAGQSLLTNLVSHTTRAKWRERVSPPTMHRLIGRFGSAEIPSIKLRTWSSLDPWSLVRLILAYLAVMISWKQYSFRIIADDIIQKRIWKEKLIGHTSRTGRRGAVKFLSARSHYKVDEVDDIWNGQATLPGASN